MNKNAIGDFPYNKAVWIGDFPQPLIDPFDPYRPSMTPVPTQLVPLNEQAPIHFNNSAQITIGNLPNAWRVSTLNDRVIATIDVPGCKLDDIQLRIENSHLTIAAQRSKGSGLSFIKETVVLIHDIDPATAHATLENGVLEVVVFRTANFPVHVVTITQL